MLTKSIDDFENLMNYSYDKNLAYFSSDIESPNLILTKILEELKR